MKKPQRSVKSDADVLYLQEAEVKAVAAYLPSASLHARGLPLESCCTAALMSREIEAAESRSAAPPAN